MVLLEGQVDLVLGRIVEVKVPEAERDAIGMKDARFVATAWVQFLGTVRPDTLQVAPGVASYPRLGDRVYSAPHELIARIPELMSSSPQADETVLNLGCVSGRSQASVSVRPEKMFGRHCAVLGATGGGKSWTVARLVEECAARGGKVLLLDATGEYRTMEANPAVAHVHMGAMTRLAKGSLACSMPSNAFIESDFLALFQPSGKVQGPKMREAIKSLRLVALEPKLGHDGLLLKANQPKKRWEQALRKHYSKVEDPTTSFNPRRLALQIGNECVWPDLGKDLTTWGGRNEAEYGFCMGLLTRVEAIITSRAFIPVFGTAATISLPDALDDFLPDESKRVLRVCLGGLLHEYRARELIVNAIGRKLLERAREGAFRECPLIVVVDEAHAFLGRTVGDEDAAVRLDAFELIAREGRKYGLNLCLATQRPRDLTESVLSQIGTLIVHRLTNDRDREVVERACGEIDRAATAFLANLRQGEAAIVGVDFPIPLTIQVTPPTHRPESDGPDYQRAWRAASPSERS
jgi:hypothetical protein